MRRTSTTLSAAGVSNWIPLNTHAINPTVGLAVVLNSTGNLTYDVEHTFSDLANVQDITISRTTTTATVTHVAHGLVTGDCSVIMNTGTTNFDGNRTVTVTDADTYTFTCANSGVTTASGKAVPLNVFNHGTLAAQTTSQDGVYDAPISACRLNVTAYTAGNATLHVIPQ